VHFCPHPVLSSRTGPDADQPVPKPLGPDGDELVQVRVDKVEATFGRGDQVMGADLAGTVTNRSSISQGVLQGAPIVYGDLELSP